MRAPVVVRNQRARNARHNAPAPAPVAHNEHDDNSDNENAAQLTDEKMGAKKRAKLEAKEQKRLQREQELKLREEKKAKEATEELERQKQAEIEAKQEQKQLEAERLAREEQERKELEEYLKLKATFSVEEQGFQENEEEAENLLDEFKKYIFDNKVVLLEDLATQFKLKTQQAIERIQDLQANNTITGVIDDRGKFIYISEDELQSVATFIRQRGRVSIAELAESSNNLIGLTPIASN